MIEIKPRHCPFARCLLIVTGSALGFLNSAVKWGEVPRLVSTIFRSAARYSDFLLA